MPPKRRGKAASLESIGQASKPMLVHISESNLNADHNMHMVECRDTILGHDVFKDMPQMQALEIKKSTKGESGFTEPFDDEKCSIALGSRQRYDAGWNFWHLDVLSKATTGVPVNMNKVKQYRDHFLEKADELHGKIIGVVEKKAHGKIFVSQLVT